MYDEYIDSREGFNMYDEMEYNEWLDAQGDEDEYEYEDEYDGQPDEYTEWQDYMGGDDCDFGQFDNEY